MPSGILHVCVGWDRNAGGERQRHLHLLQRAGAPYLHLLLQRAGGAHREGRGGHPQIFAQLQQLRVELFLGQFPGPAYIGN